MALNLPIPRNESVNVGIVTYLPWLGHQVFLATPNSPRTPPPNPLRATIREAVGGVQGFRRSAGSSIDELEPMLVHAFQEFTGYGKPRRRADHRINIAIWTERRFIRSRFAVSDPFLYLGRRKHTAAIETSTQFAA